MSADEHRPGPLSGYAFRRTVDPFSIAPSWLNPEPQRLKPRLILSTIYRDYRRRTIAAASAGTAMLASISAYHTTMCNNPASLRIAGPTKGSRNSLTSAHAKSAAKGSTVRANHHRFLASSNPNKARTQYRTALCAKGGSLSMTSNISSAGIADECEKVLMASSSVTRAGFAKLLASTHHRDWLFPPQPV